MDWMPIFFFEGIYKMGHVAVLIEDGHIKKAFVDEEGEEADGKE